MKKLPLLCLWCALAAAQTAKFPTEVVDDTQLKVIANRATTTLSSPIVAGSDAMVLADASKFKANMLLTIEDASGTYEIVNVCAAGASIVSIGTATACPSVLGRAQDGTTAISHAAGARVSAYVDAWHHAAVSAEIKAIEGALGAGLSKVVTTAGSYTNPAWLPSVSAAVALAANGSNCPSGQWPKGVDASGNAEGCIALQASDLPVAPGQTFLEAANYDWSRTGLAINILAGASATIAITGCPDGVNVAAWDSATYKHYLRVEAGATPGVVYVTGGTCAPGVASGTLTLHAVTAVNGATLKSATGGILEALRSLPIDTSDPLPGMAGFPRGEILIKPGTINIYAPIVMPGAPVTFRGSGRYSTKLHVAADYATAFPKNASNIDNSLFLFNGWAWDPSDEIRGWDGQVTSLTVNYDQAASSLVNTDYTQYPPTFGFGGTQRFAIRDVTVERAWDVLKVIGGNGGSVENLWASAFHRGIDIDDVWDMVTVDGYRWWRFGLSDANQKAAFWRGTYPLWVGKCDGLTISNSMLLGGKSNFHSTATGQPWAQIVNTYFDSVGGLEVASGFVTVNGSTFTQGYTTGMTAVNSIKQTGGDVRCYGCRFVAAAESTVPIIAVNITEAAAAHTEGGVTFRPFKTLIDGAEFIQYNSNSAIITATSTSVAPFVVQVTNSYFGREGVSMIGNPAISLASGAGSPALIVTGNYATKINFSDTTIYSDLVQYSAGNFFAPLIAHNRLENGWREIAAGSDPNSYLQPLKTATWTNISAAASDAPPSIVWCSNCTAGACATPGPGAIAIYNGSAWVCK